MPPRRSRPGGGRHGAVSNRLSYHRHPFARLFRAVEDLTGRRVLGHGAHAVEQQVERGMGALTERIGGPARMRVVVLLAAVLGLSSADTGAISAVAPQLERYFHIGNVDIGLLVTVSAITAALGMLPVGWVTDRWNRTRLVTVAVVLWGLAELLSAVSPSFTFLLMVRLALGAMTAVAGPTLASLTGDLFPARERSQIYGYILTGELLGAGFGLLVAGLVSAAVTWRVAFAVLALPSFYLAWQLHRRLPEPARGGQSRLERGAEEIVTAADARTGVPASGGPRTPTGGTSDNGAAGTSAPPEGVDTEVLRGVRRAHVDARRGVVPDRNPMELGWWDSFRYVLAVPTNVTLILASALGYFFLTGVETFALIYIEGHYGTTQTVATFVVLAVGAAAVVGAVVGGRATDSLLHRGYLDARLVVPAVAFLVACAVFVPGAVVPTLAIAVPLFVVAGFCIAVPNPGMDAARLDVMPSRMWGRAEAVRSLLRSVLQAFAPLLFGLLSMAFGGEAVGFGTSAGFHSHHTGHLHVAGLEQTFLIMVSTLLLAGYFAWRGRRPYPTDVAAASRTDELFPPTPTREPVGGRPGAP